MTAADFAFYMFAIITVSAGLMVTISRNPVHSVLWLILAFLSTSGLFVMLGAEFVAMLLVIVYVGAVAVLFLFVVMMLDVNFDALRRDFRSYLPVAVTVGLLVLFEMTLLLVNATRGSAAAPVPAAATESNTRALGRLIYVDYVYPLEIAAVVLLVAIVAAIALTHRRRRATRYQDPAEQVKVKSRDRVRIVEMPSEKRET